MTPLLLTSLQDSVQHKYLAAKLLARSQEKLVLSNYMMPWRPATSPLLVYRILRIQPAITAYSFRYKRMNTPLTETP